MYKCILFDVDGTIIDTEKAVMLSLLKLLKIETGKDYDPAELSFVLGIPGKDAMKKLGFPDVEKTAAEWNIYIKEFYNHITVFPGVEDILKKLSGLKIKIGIVTSKTRQEMKDDFHPFGLMKYFAHVICFDDTINHKPDPEPMIKALEVCGVSPEETLYIGDTLYDKKCSEGAGVDFALALWGTKTPELEAKIKIAFPEEIIDFVLSE